MGVPPLARGKTDCFAILFAHREVEKLDCDHLALKEV